MYQISWARVFLRVAFFLISLVILSIEKKTTQGERGKDEAQ